LEKKDVKHFIQTSDEEVAKELRENGYQELSKQGKFFIFINEAKKVKTFDENKIVYTDILSV
jgi:hypothetical protein